MRILRRSVFAAPLRAHYRCRSMRFCGLLGSCRIAFGARVGQKLMTLQAQRAWKEGGVELSDHTGSQRLREGHRDPLGHVSARRGAWRASEEGDPRSDGWPSSALLRIPESGRVPELLNAEARLGQQPVGVGVGGGAVEPHLAYLFHLFPKSSVGTNPAPIASAGVKGAKGVVRCSQPAITAQRMRPSSTSNASSAPPPRRSTRRRSSRSCVPSAPTRRPCRSRSRPAPARRTRASFRSRASR